MFRVQELSDELMGIYNNLEEFRMGLAVELEHGSADPETNVTNDDEVMTAKITWAHLKEIPDYYTRLLKMEKEAGS